MSEIVRVKLLVADARQPGIVFQRQVNTAARKDQGTVLDLFGGFGLPEEVAQAAIERRLQIATSLDVAQLALRHLYGFPYSRGLSGECICHVFAADVPTMDF